MGLSPESASRRVPVMDSRSMVAGGIVSTERLTMLPCNTAYQ